MAVRGASGEQGPSAGWIGKPLAPNDPVHRQGLPLMISIQLGASRSTLYFVCRGLSPPEGCSAGDPGRGRTVREGPSARAYDGTSSIVAGSESSFMLGAVTLAGVVPHPIFRSFRSDRPPWDGTECHRSSRQRAHQAISSIASSWVSPLRRARDRQVLKSAARLRSASRWA